MLLLEKTPNYFTTLLQDSSDSQSRFVPSIIPPFTNYTPTTQPPKASLGPTVTTTLGIRGPVVCEILILK